MTEIVEKKITGSPTMRSSINSLCPAVRKRQEMESTTCWELEEEDVRLSGRPIVTHRHFFDQLITTHQILDIFYRPITINILN